jgi:hypothetical protein
MNSVASVAVYRRCLQSFKDNRFKIMLVKRQISVTCGDEAIQVRGM